MEIVLVAAVEKHRKVKLHPESLRIDRKIKRGTRSLFPVLVFCQKKEKIEIDILSCENYFTGGVCCASINQSE